MKNYLNKKKFKHLSQLNSFSKENITEYVSHLSSLEKEEFEKEKNDFLNMFEYKILPVLQNVVDEFVKQFNIITKSFTKWYKSLPNEMKKRIEKSIKENVCE